MTRSSRALPSPQPFCFVTQLKLDRQDGYVFPPSRTITPPGQHLTLTCLSPSAGAPSTTIVPFTNTAVLPSCATACGPLYDANGGCVPPAANVGSATTAYTTCFCSNTAVSPFSTAATGVCDDACGTEGLSSIASWFQSICSVNQKDTNNDDNSDSSETSATATAKASSSGGNGDW